MDIGAIIRLPSTSIARVIPVVQEESSVTSPNTLETNFRRARGRPGPVHPLSAGAAISDYYHIWTYVL